MCDARVELHEEEVPAADGVGGAGGPGTPRTLALALGLAQDSQAAVFVWDNGAKEAVLMSAPYYANVAVGGCVSHCLSVLLVDC